MVAHYIEAFSSYAGDIDNLILLILLLVGFWFVLVEGAFIYLILRFRANGGRSQYITGEEKSQKRWITTPHNVVLLCDLVIIVFAVKVWVDVKQTLPEPDLTIRITGQQWAWTFQTPGPDGELDTEDDIRSVDELHLEVGKVYHYKLEARDVLHSFSVPIFRLKQDAVPGREIVGWFEPTEVTEGRTRADGSPHLYEVQCAEMCGIGHGIMSARLFVHTPDDYAAWATANAGKNTVYEHPPSLAAAELAK